MTTSEGQPRRITVVDLGHEIPLRTGDQTATGYQYRRPETPLIDVDSSYAPPLTTVPQETKEAIEHVLWKPAELSRP